MPGLTKQWQMGTYLCSDHQRQLFTLYIFINLECWIWNCKCKNMNILLTAFLIKYHIFSLHKYLINKPIEVVPEKTLFSWKPIDILLALHWGLNVWDGSDEVEYDVELGITWVAKTIGCGAYMSLGKNLDYQCNSINVCILC